MLKSNTRRGFRAQSPTPFNNADIAKDSIIGELHIDLIKNIANQHHQKLHNSQRLFLLKNWEVIIKKRKTSVPFSLRVYYVLAEDDAIFRAVALGIQAILLF
ncbi:unnamed protein product [Clonostachys chloroleuca]|uniref:Uncharacterized protein n=1 Tax=Clonostachys chloroleuca TaxID=1926264 RepID=A0AA35MC85_9HYPO|nr:unnamed protein product [Clonostachys chloroleuca]